MSRERSRTCYCHRLRSSGIHRRHLRRPRPISSLCLITGMEQGGQLMTTTEVDNWPGAVNGIEGPQLDAEPA